MNPDNPNDDPRPEDQQSHFTASFDRSSGEPTDLRSSGEGSLKKSQANRIGEVIGGYKLRRFLGEGGFGEVYAARHTKTNRVVAIKLIRSDRVASKALKRFEVETEAMKRLGHPNVAKIYQGGKTDAGEPYLAIEFVEGVPLCEYCDNRHHTIDERLQLFLQVCAGAQHIHSNGLIHRDLSPDNILVTEEKGEDGKTYPVPKIIDLGVASAIDEDINMAQSLSLSIDFGRLVGKFAYMSPEMAEGGLIRPDIRTDIFSLGVILYELITGVQPLSNDTLKGLAIHKLTENVARIERPAPSTAYGRLDADTAEKIRLARNIPTEKELTRYLNGRLRHLPMTALRLDRNKRFTAVAALANDIENYLHDRDYVQAAQEPRRDRMLRNLRRYKVPYAAAAVALCALTLGIIGTTIGMKWAKDEAARANAAETAAEARRTEALEAPERKMIVVLPFENLGQPEDEYFASGMTEEITSRLAVVSGLGVISRTSAFQYERTGKNIKQIGEDFGVDYVLEGTVRWARQSGGASRVRITPQLIRVRDDTHLWAETFERVIDDIFEIQSDIAGKVIEQLGVTLLEPERRVVEARPTDVIEAYDAYLRGNQYVNRDSTGADLRIAVQMYERAVALDPDFALAYAKLSEVHSRLYWFHYDWTKERLAKAEAAVKKAFQLEPGLPEAHQAQGFYYYWGHLDYDRALEQFSIALKSQPNNSKLFFGMGLVRRRQGKLEQAVANLEKAVELDPFSAESLQQTANTYQLLRDYEVAERYWDRASSLRPDWSNIVVFRALCYLNWQGNPEKARRVLEEAEQAIGSINEPHLIFVWVLVDVCAGNYQAALDRLSLASADALATQYFFIPKAQLSAQIHGLMNRPQLENTDYETARALLEAKLQNQPQDSRLHSSLGIVYAGLGRMAEAIRAGKKGVELLPMSKEAWRGAYRVEDLARIYVMTGEYDAAVDQLEFLLSNPGNLSASLLRLDPRWKPLWDHPRFQELIEKYE